MAAIDSNACQAVSPVGIPESARDRLQSLRVMIVGLGNIGSYLSLLLAPLIGYARMVDRGHVKPHNAANQMYGPQMVDRPKVDATAQFLSTYAPQLMVDPRVADAEDLPWDDFADVDVVMAGLDSLLSRQTVSERTYPLKIPYIDGAVGEPLLTRVQVLLPGQGCLQCDWSPNHVRQVASEHPCEPGGSPIRPRTLAPNCAGAAAAATMVAQLIKLFSDQPPTTSYEITGDLLAGRSVASRRRLNDACRFDHQTPVEFGLDVAFPEATTGHLVRLLTRTDTVKRICGWRPGAGSLINPYSQAIVMLT